MVNNLNISTYVQLSLQEAGSDSGELDFYLVHSTYLFTGTPTFP